LGLLIQGKRHTEPGEREGAGNGGNDPLHVEREGNARVRLVSDAGGGYATKKGFPVLKRRVLPEKNVMRTKDSKRKRSSYTRSSIAEGKRACRTAEGGISFWGDPLRNGTRRELRTGESCCRQIRRLLSMREPIGGKIDGNNSHKHRGASAYEEQETERAALKKIASIEGR